MRFGLAVPQHREMDLRTDIPLVATTAEREGFSSLWVYERLVYPVHPRQGLYDVPGLPWQPAYRNNADPLTVLAVAAACTETVRLGQSVLVASLHHPVRLATTLATIDRIAGGGRVIAGLGSGWMYDEFDAVGASRGRRGADLEETVAVLRAVWGADPVSHHGATVELDEVIVGPKPVRPIPIMIGGGASDAAAQRIARLADGYLGSQAPGAAIVGIARRFERLAAEHGRPDLRLEVINRANIVLLEQPFAGDERPPYVGDFDQIVSDLAGNVAAGVDEMILELQLQEGFAGARWMLDTARALREAAERV